MIPHGFPEIGVSLLGLGRTQTSKLKLVKISALVHNEEVINQAYA